MIRSFAIFPAFILWSVVAGCQEPELNPTPPTSESAILSDYVQLTHGFARAGEAYFSPDMKWIIFQASMKMEEDYSMYLAQLKWSADQISGIDTPIRISPEGSWNSCGYFSPDGNSLIFASSRKPLVKDAPAPTTAGSGRSRYAWAMPKEAEIFRAEGWKGSIAALAPGGSADLAQVQLTHNDAYDAEGSYSPDGQWVVYGSKATGDAEVWAMRADGSKQVQLTHNPGTDGGPYFSPDGKRITFRADRKSDQLVQVFVADLVFDGAGNITGIQNEKQLTQPLDQRLSPDATINWTPYWHPDNHHLVWASTAHGHANWEVYLMRDDGSRKTRITFTNGFDALPVISPDGKWMMWTSARGAEKTTQIWVARFKMPKGS